MNTHKRIIGICWIIMGALFLTPLVLKFGDMSGIKAAGIAAVSLTFVAAGFSLVANLRRSSWVCLPCSALSLFTFPIGTVIGAYYLWFYIKVERVN